VRVGEGGVDEERADVRFDDVRKALWVGHVSSDFTS
jgi:hypothetical protein